MSDSENIANSSSSSEDEKVVEDIKEITEEVKEEVKEKVEDIKKETESVVSTQPSSSSSSSTCPVSSSTTTTTTTTTEAGCPYSVCGNNSIFTAVCKVSSVIKKNPLYEPAKQIVLWNDLIQTGLLFIIINTVFFITCCLKYSLLSLVGYVGFVVTAVSLLFNLVQGVISKSVQGISLDNQITEQLKTLSFHVHEAVVEKHAVNIAELINTLLAIAKDVFSVRSIYYSAQFLIVFWLTGSIGKCVTLNTIAYVSFLILFIAPRLYLEKQDLIDPQVQKVKEISKELLTKLHSFIPVSHSQSNPKKTN